MEEITNSISCNSCSRELPFKSRFCRYCGSDRFSAEVEGANRNLLTALIIFYAIEVIICSIVTFNDNYKGLNVLLIADSIMAATAIGFSCYIKRDILPVLKWKNFSMAKVAMYTGIAILFSIPVHYSVKWLNSSIFDTDSYYYFAFLEFKHPFLWMLFVIAIAPAIFEELAYRGFVLGALLKVMDTKAAIFISSFVFALIHFSLLSFFWMLPFALLLGHIRTKEKTLWYGIIIHFTFNAVSCLLEYYELKLF